MGRTKIVLIVIAIGAAGAYLSTGGSLNVGVLFDTNRMTPTQDEFNRGMDRAAQAMEDIIPGIGPNVEPAEAVNHIVAAMERQNVNLEHRRSIALTEEQFQQLLQLAKASAPLEVEPGVWFTDATGDNTVGIIYHMDVRAVDFAELIELANSDPEIKSLFVSSVLEEQGRVGVCRIIGALNVSYPVTYRYSTSSNFVDVTREVGACDL